MSAVPEPLVELAPAKVNLVLQVGPRRDDGLHELCSLFASLELADTLRFEVADADDGQDEVHCPGVEGPNLITAALGAYRDTVPDAVPSLWVTVNKRIPVAAGLGGGSADAAAAMRAANRLAGGPLDADALRALGRRLGSDVPSQIEPGHATDTERELSGIPRALVVVQAEAGLSTAAVYEEADRIGSTRERLDPQGVRALAGRSIDEIAAALANDLQAAALSLRPELEATLRALLDHGARGALVSGSGPTVFGVFEDLASAEEAASEMPGALVTRLRG